MNIKKILLGYLLMTLCVFLSNCSNKKTYMYSGTLLDFGIKQPNQPNCNAIYFISEINDCEDLKQTIPVDSITIEIKGGCFDSIDFSFPKPRLRHMNDNKFSITTRSCYLDTVDQIILDSLAVIWKQRIKINIKFQNKNWLISSNGY